MKGIWEKRPDLALEKSIWARFCENKDKKNCTQHCILFSKFVSQKYMAEQF